MVNQWSTLDLTFSALADPVRRSVLARLLRAEATVGDLAAAHPMSLPGFLKHIQILERAGLVTTNKVGRQRVCQAIPSRLVEARDWIEENRKFWEGQLDSLELFLKKQTTQEKK